MTEYAYGLFPMHEFTAFIGTEQTAEEWTYAPLNEGLENVTEAINETVQQYYFFKDKGFAKNHVTGLAPIFTFTGRRVIGDAAQDYIFDKKYKLDKNRQSSFKMTYKNAEGKLVTLTCPCTIANPQEWSGGTAESSAISFEIRFDGKPTETVDTSGV